MVAAGRGSDRDDRLSLSSPGTYVRAETGAGSRNSLEKNSPMGRLADALAAGRILLADGATGTNLFDMGLQAGDAPELWNRDFPDRVRTLHRAFVDAGADIVLTNTFGANARRLKLHDAEGDVAALNEAAIALARREADAAERTVLVAGSVGPTGDLLEPLGPLTTRDAEEVFTEQMKAIADAGADAIWIETMSAPNEMRAALSAAEKTGLDTVLTASFDTAGRTMMGLSPRDLPEIGSLGAVAVGANCGVGASDLLAAILDIEVDHPPFIVAKANCGVPVVRGDEVVYTGTPATMAEYVRLAVDAGASIIGGCCGTTPDHLVHMRRALDEHQRSERPTLPEIAERTGAFVNSVGATDERGRTRRRGRRSR